MRVILRSDVPNLGNKGDVVDVADGFARNFLLPRGQALVASAGAEAQAEGMRRSRAVKDATERAAAEEIAKTLVPATIRVAARAGAPAGDEPVKLFGSVTTAEIVEAVREQTGIELDRKLLHLDEPIRTTGTHQAQARLHPDVHFPVTVEVTPA